MFYHQQHSLVQYNQLHPALQKIADGIGEMRQFKILEAYRTKADQEADFAKHVTKVHYPDSAHNHLPSVAFDFIPEPFNGWAKIDDFRVIAREALAVSTKLLIPIRWGGDWNRNGSELDEKGLRDFGHIELYPWRDWASGKVKLPVKSPMVLVNTPEDPEIASVEAVD